MKDQSNLIYQTHKFMAVITDYWNSKYVKKLFPKDVAKSENKVSNWLESHDQTIEIRNFCIILLLMFAGGKRGNVLKNMTIQHFDERKEIEGTGQIENFEHKTKSSRSALVTFPKNSLPDRVCQIYRNIVQAQFKKLLAEGESTSVKEALRPEEYLFVSKNDWQLKKMQPLMHWSES
jgi:hypothetical protein